MEESADFGGFRMDNVQVPADRVILGEWILYADESLRN